jgi:hypothetical protein
MNASGLENLLGQARRVTGDPRFVWLAVSIATIVAGLYIGADYVTRWAGAWSAYSHDSEITEKLEARANALVRENAKALPHGGSLILEGRTAAIAAANLQRRFSEIATTAGASIKNVDTPRSEDSGESGGAAQRIRVEAMLALRQSALPDLLQALEENYPLMIVDRMTAAPDTRAQEGADPNSEPEDPILNVTLAISGYWPAGGTP